MKPLAMTAGRRDAFARVAAARFDRHEAMLAPAIEAAINDWLALALAAALPEITASVPTPDPPAGGDAIGRMLASFTVADADATVARLRRLGPRFAGLLDRHVMPTYKRMLDEVLGTALSDGRVAADLIEWRSQWLAQRRQVLVGIPDTITSIFRSGLLSLARKDGTDVTAAADYAKTMLSAGYPSWPGRARLIARTETVGANNQGSLASWTSLARATDQEMTKTWLATEDARTRPDHLAVNGTTVGIHDTFSVGGEDMNGPGDDSASGAQVCNCRCTLTYNAPDDGDSMTSAAVEPTTAPAGGDTSDDAPTGVAIMLGLGAGDEAAILAAPGVPEPAAPGLHCTMAYLSEPAAAYSDDQKAALLAALAPLTPEGTAESFATAHFNPNSDARDPAAVLLVQSAWLDQLHGDVEAAVRSAGLELSTTFPTWIPHVTVAYDADPSIIPDHALGELGFNRLVVGWGGEQHVVAGDGAEQITAAAVDPATDDGDVTAPTDAPPATDPAPATTPAPTDAPGAAGGATGALDLTPQGQTWSGVLGRLDYNSDGRVIAAAGGAVRPLPLPLSWQRESGDGHDDSVVVGRLLSVELRQDPTLGPIVWGAGDWLDPMLNYESQQAMAQVDAGLGLVSLDLAVLAYGFADQNGNPLDPALSFPPDTEVLEVATAWELGGVTIVSFPAFAEARITNDPLPDDEPTPEGAPLVNPGPVSTSAFSAANPAGPTISDDGTSITLSDGTTVAVGDLVGIPDYDNDGDDEAGTITAIDAGAQSVTVSPVMDDGEAQDPDMQFPVAQLTPAAPPAPATADGDAAAASLTAAVALRPYTAAFFNRPEADGPTPLTVDPDTGEVYGHLATYDTCHVGKMAENGSCVTAPRSERDYTDFHLTPVLTDEGPLDVGRLTVGTGHAAPGGGFANAVAHYDNTGTQVAVVRAKDGEHGIWLSGQLIHDVPAGKVEELMRSPLSGDWRRRHATDDHLELCAALAVNVPGFPIRRPVLEVGQRPGIGQMSLVAAGVVMRGEHTVVHGEITLPSGASITRTDLEALVAAATDALRAGKVSSRDTTEVEALALRKARARLALAGR